jgi:hypothetical protein
MAKSSASFKPGHVGGGALTGGSPLWRKGGPSPNPTGKSKLRREFEQSFLLALEGTLSPRDLAEILSKAARNGEAFAISKLAELYLPSLRDKAAAEAAETEAGLQFDFELLTASERVDLEGLLAKCRKKPV